jgi:hypothetical protein
MKRQRKQLDSNKILSEPIHKKKNPAYPAIKE